MAYSGTLRIVAGGTEAVVAEGAAYNIPYDLEFIAVLLNGTADGQADLWHKDERTLATGNETLDLTNLAGGSAARKPAADNFAIVKGVIVHNTGAGLLTVGAGSTPFDGTTAYLGGATDTRPIPAGGIDVWYNPSGATTTSATDLKFTAAADTTYTVIIIGESA